MFPMEPLTSLDFQWLEKLGACPDFDGPCGGAGAATVDRQPKHYEQTGDFLSIGTGLI